MPRILALLAMTVLLAAADQALPVALFRNLQAGKPQVVITYGTSLTEHGPWVAMLQPWFEARYKGQVTVVNSGGSGQHSGWGIQNVKARVVDKKPDLVFVEFGINDAHVKFKLTPEGCRKNLDGIIAAIRGGNAQADIVLMTMNHAVDAPGKTAGSDRPKLADFYANYAACAGEMKLPFIDNQPDWRKLDDKAFLKFAADGLHPGKDGILAVTWPNIERLLLAAEAAAKKR